MARVCWVVRVNCRPKSQHPERTMVRLGLQKGQIVLIRIEDVQGGTGRHESRNSYGGVVHVLAAGGAPVHRGWLGGGHFSRQEVFLEEGDEGAHLRCLVHGAAEHCGGGWLLVARRRMPTHL